MQSREYSIVKGKPLFVFIYFSLPWVVGMVTLSMAGIADGFFLGNYVGAEALSAVNIVMPFHALLYGIGLMFTVGGSVLCAAYLGEGEEQKARAIFTKIMAALVVVSAVLTLLGMIFSRHIVVLLGAKGVLIPHAVTYLRTTVPFFIFYLTTTGLAYFARLNGHHVAASLTLALAALSNILLDYLFVALLRFGTAGAGVASGLSYLIGLMLILPLFLHKPGVLRFTSRTGDLREILYAAYNGLSEFFTEISAGLAIALFNWVIIRYQGIRGVAAFTLINYLFWFALMVCYGISDTLQPVISTNRGAGKPLRVQAFLRISLVIAGGMGVLFALILLLFPRELLSFFMTPGSSEMHYALGFIRFIWPAFLLNGITIIFSSYFTSMELPFESMVVSLSRSLLFPALFVLLLPLFMGELGIFLAIPLGEGVAFVITIALFIKNRPRQLMVAAKAN